MHAIELLYFLNRVDKTIYEHILIYADPPWLRSICEFIVHKNNLYPFLIIFFVYSIFRNPKKGFILLATTLILLGLSDATASFIKNLVERHRPIYQMGIYIAEGGYSFPSAHAVNSMAFAVFYSWKFPKASPLLYSLAIVIGISRMLATYHFPGDIMGGWIAGFLVGYLYVLVWRNAEERFAKKISHQGTAESGQKISF